MALMNYLLKKHPTDHEKMQMVALKFGMFRELAKAREDQAKRDLRRIRPKHLGMWTLIRALPMWSRLDHTLTTFLGPFHPFIAYKLSLEATRDY